MSLKTAARRWAVRADEITASGGGEIGEEPGSSPPSGVAACACQPRRDQHELIGPVDMGESGFAVGAPTSSSRTFVSAPVRAFEKARTARGSAASAEVFEGEARR